MDEKPKWVKILKFISFLIPILMIVYAVIEVALGNSDIGLFIGLIFVVVLVIIGMWLFGFFIHYLVKKGKSGLALAIAIICFFGTLIWYIVGYLIATSGPYLSGFGFSIASILIYLLPLIYFGVAWILVYKIKKKVKD